MNTDDTQAEYHTADEPARHVAECAQDAFSRCEVVAEFFDPTGEQVPAAYRATAALLLAAAERLAPTPQVEAADAEAEKLALQEELREQGKRLFAALTALAGMWNQYCPPITGAFPCPGHMFMSAGEEAEEVLNSWGLLRADETAIDPDWKDGLDEAPAAVRALIGLGPAAAATAPEAGPVGGLPGGNAAGYDAIARILARHCQTCNGHLNGHGECVYCEPEKVASHG